MFPSAVCRLAGTLFVLLLLSFSVALANPVSAVADGHWNNPLTWEDGLVPGSSDQVTIPTGITVELSGTHSAQTLTVNGTLRAAGDASVDLSAEWIMVMGPGALFEVGTPGAPFPAEYDFTLTLTGANTGGSMMGMGEKFLGAMNGGQIELHGAPKVSWTRLGASSFLGANQLTLADPVDWQQGDEIVVVSSRINWAEAEQRTLNAVSADGLTLTLNVGLLLPHLSTVETHTRPTDGKTWTADMRAEVGLLTHNVKVQGDATSEVDGFGGHIMIMPGSVGNASHIELFRMGQKAELGRYPWHWHLLHETGLGQSFKHSSVHRSFNRALTIHGTSYVEVADNFFYDHIGHGLFLEDGSERYNSILNNVVVASKRPAPGEEVTPSDNQFNEVQNRTPASFWITNPNNIFEGNVAAGTEGTGYWFALPQAPMGSSAGNPLFDGIEPFREPLGSFVGNTAHSCMSGFDIFDQLFPDHSIRKNAGWQETGEHLIDGCTWYANSLGVYSGIGGAVGDNVTYTANLKFSDNIFVANATAIQLASYSQVVESAIVAHAQANYIAGMASLYRIYDGAGQIRDCHLVGWSAPNADYLKDGGAATKHTNHRVSGITTDDGLPPRVDMRDYDIPPSPTDMTPQSLSHPRVWNMVLLDEDGSLTGTAGHSVVSNHPMMRVGDEVQPSNWVNAFISPHRFDLGVLEFPDLPQGDIPNVTCTRTKTGTPTESVYYIHGYKEHIQLPLIVNEGYLYSYQFESLPATREMVVELDDAEAGDALWIRLVGLGDLGGLTIGSPDLGLVEMGTLLDLANSPQAGYFVEPGGDIYLNVTATGRLQQVGLAWDVDVTLPPLDTDGDGVSDGDEIANGTDPFATDVDVSGCTYVGACNYNPDADVEDGSCLFPPVGCPWPSNSAIVGCTYFDALNYSPQALYDDGTCAWSDQSSSCPADVNGDGMVAVQDILLVLGSYGTPCIEPVANMLLIGNSFFKPYAQNLDNVTEQAGLTQYQSLLITRGGDNGRPINFWNDSTTESHNQIKAALDQGNIEMFGMTPGHEPDNPIEGHAAWIDYALQNNPDITIFISLSPLDFPANWDSTAAAYGYDSIDALYPALVDSIHSIIVDPLRAMFPSTNIFTIPTGWAAVELAGMQQAGTLLDDIDLFGPKATSIFTDDKGHQGQIVIEAGTLIWLESIYGIDLETNTYDTGFETDLHEIAIQIAAGHDPEYKQ